MDTFGTVQQPKHLDPSSLQEKESQHKLSSQSQLGVVLIHHSQLIPSSLTQIRYTVLKCDWQLKVELNLDQLSVICQFKFKSARQVCDYHNYWSLGRDIAKKQYAMRVKRKP